MTTRKFGRTALIAVLALSIVMSITGGTIAWFTDEVTSANNIIKAGTLDVAMTYYDETIANWKDASTGAIFNYDKWEPGYTQLRQVKISNVGDLAFKFQLKLKPTTPIVEGNVNLSDVIDVYYGTGAVPTDLAGVKAGTLAGNITKLAADEDGMAYGVLLPASGKAAANAQLPDGVVAPSGEIEMWVALHMQETADNKYQGKSVGDGFALQLVATQYTYEKDSFDNTYDANALLVDPNAPKAGRADIPVSDLPTDVMIYQLPGFAQTGNTTDVDVGYVFTAVDTPEQAKLNEYADWHADFVVTVNGPLKANTCGLAGQYDAWDSEWYAFALPQDAKAGDEFRLLNNVGPGIKFNYVELCETVKAFSCGVYNDNLVNAGTSITVELRLYEPLPEDVEKTNTNDEGETGKYITVLTESYTLK